MKREKKRELNREDAERVENLILREKTSNFSLKYRAIQPSKVFEARRKAILRGAGYAWTPDFRSFDKLREVGVSPYLGFILYLSTLLMFELNEAVRGRLIGLKSWNQNVRNFFYPFLWSVVVHGCLG